jgi:hypothetical protein
MADMFETLLREALEVFRSHRHRAPEISRQSRSTTEDYHLEKAGVSGPLQR